MSNEYLIYYLCRQSNGEYSVDSVCSGNEPPENIIGFVRRTPEITHPDDMTPELLAKFKEEVANLP